MRVKTGPPIYIPHRRLKHIIFYTEMAILSPIIIILFIEHVIRIKIVRWRRRRKADAVERAPCQH